MRVVCAWCGVVISESTEATPVSHGICASCSMTLERSFFKSRLLKGDAQVAARRPRRTQAPSLPLPGFVAASRS